MKQKCLSVFAAIAASVFATACTKSSPTRPTETAASEAVSSILDAKSGVTLVSPQLISPAPGLRLKFAEQPVTLTVKNGVSTGSTPLTYTFQVAGDAAFGSIVFSREGVTEGAGQTALTIDKLAGNKDYYWRARASAGSAVGLFSAIRTFNVGPEVVLQAPTVTAPTNGGQLSSQALLVVNNAQRTGPAGALTYRFEVSASSSFGNLAFVAPNVAEQANQTSVRMDANLTTNGTYYLRVRASDNSNGITGPYSSTIQFKYVPFDLSQAIILNSPPDLAVWPEGAKVTSINFTGDAFEVDFDRRDGPNRWPDVIPAGFEGALQYHPRYVCQQPQPVVLLGRGAVLVRTAALRFHAAELCWRELVLRSGPLGTHQLLSAAGRRTGRPLGRRGQLARREQHHARDVPGRLRAVERRARPVVELRFGLVHVLIAREDSGDQTLTIA